MAMLVHVCDDGIDSWGFMQTRRQLCVISDVPVVSLVTRENVSGMGGSIYWPYKINPILIETIDSGGIFVGQQCTLLDMIRWFWASHETQDEYKDSLILAGVNRGCSSTDDFLYSSTLASTIWAALKGIPAIAISMDENIYEQCREYPEYFNILLSNICSRDIWRTRIGTVSAFNIRTINPVYRNCNSFHDEYLARKNNKSSIWRLNINEW